MANNNIGLAIAIKIRRRDGPGIEAAERQDNGGPKNAVAIAQKEAEGFSVVVSREQIDIAVVIEIGCGQRHRIGADSIVDLAHQIGGRKGHRVVVRIPDTAVIDELGAERAVAGYAIDGYQIA